MNQEGSRTKEGVVQVFVLWRSSRRQINEEGFELRGTGYRLNQPVPFVATTRAN